MKELVVISGKGGTGKTSVVASFAALAGRVALADCDVDAANLHLVLRPDVRRREPFSGGSSARIKPGYCVACGKCEEVCRFDAIYFDGRGNGSVPKTFRVDPIACEGCGVCAWFCAEKAIEFIPADNGQWFISTTRFGPMVHAQLNVAEENSGKLVTLVRNTARKIAEKEGIDLIISDGSPGIGCPVIASVTNADLVLAVSEPTLSGRHDLERVILLAKHFDIPILAAVNKWDINEEMTRSIEELAMRYGVETAGRIRYDRAVTDAMVHETSVVEYTDAPVAKDIKMVWEKVMENLKHK
ncbi:MAG: ATP-binding protein [Candidatus Latescibacterota bacterium]